MNDPSPPQPQTLEQRELLERREATHRAIQRNVAQAGAELRRGKPSRVIEITDLMLRGRTLRTMTAPQVPLVYFRGRAFEELGQAEEAIACFRVLAAWNGGSHPLVDDAHIYIDKSLERLVALVGTPPEDGISGTIPPERDTRVFPKARLGPGLLIAAVLFTTVMTVVALILLAIFKF